MQITIIKIGKPALEVRPLIAIYEKRIHSFVDFKLLEWKDEKKDKLSEKLKKEIKHGHLLVLLDERGKSIDSLAFSNQIQKWQDNPGIKGVVFAIGGPYGFDESLKKKADLLLAFSPLTMQGDLAWLILVEQVYRAFTILKGTGYHH